MPWYMNPDPWNRNDDSPQVVTVYDTDITIIVQNGGSWLESYVEGGNSEASIGTEVPLA